ncbi:MAG: DUF3791 domain-containing protein [Ruminiclostridium sp.]|nr:DUF3791 domain-containing protein [Ruminiclostridium sp.]
MTNGWIERGKKMSVEQLEFAVFCIENLAIRLDENAKNLYIALTEKSDILYNYIVPCYDFLHTQDKEYIIDDIIYVMKEKRLKI